MKYKNHPTIEDLEISNDGSSIMYKSNELTIREHRQKSRNILVVYIDRIRRSVPKLVLETYKGFPPEDQRYYAICKDGNIHNIHPNNLEWRHSNAKNPLKNAIKRSKLTKEEMRSAYSMYSVEKMPLNKIAKIYGVSDMTIHRAIKRYDRLTESK